MGDGEVYMTGIEVAGEVQLRLHRLAASTFGQRRLPLPLLEDDRRLVPIVTGATLDEAARGALAAGMAILTEWAGMEPLDAGFFMSAACDLRISQYLPNLGIHCRLEIPKKPLLDARLWSTPLTLPIGSARQSATNG
jgi:amidase